MLSLLFRVMTTNAGLKHYCVAWLLHWHQQSMPCISDAFIHLRLLTLSPKQGL